VAGAAGVLLATSAEWLLITAGGEAVSLGANPIGPVGAPILSPGEGLIAYSAGNTVYVAWSDNPGAPINGGVAFDGGIGAGFAFATSGEEVVVSGSGGLSLYTIYGEPLGQASGSLPVGSSFWIGDTIYFLALGQTTTLAQISASQIMAGA
jgi:hypothetical protein